jgi:hypothetical protein
MASFGYFNDYDTPPPDPGDPSSHEDFLGTELACVS